MAPSSSDFSASSVTEIALSYGINPDQFEFTPAALPANFVCCLDMTGELLRTNRTTIALVGLNTGSVITNLRAQFEVRSFSPVSDHPLTSLSP